MLIILLCWWSMLSYAAEATTIQITQNSTGLQILKDLVAAGNYREAIKLGQSLLSEHGELSKIPDIAEIHYLVGYSWSALEDYHNAINYFEQASRLSEDSKYLLFWGISARKIGDIDQSLDLLEKAVLIGEEPFAGRALAEIQSLVNYSMVKPYGDLYYQIVLMEMLEAEETNPLIKFSEFFKLLHAFVSAGIFSKEQLNAISDAFYERHSGINAEFLAFSLLTGYFSKSQILKYLKSFDEIELARLSIYLGILQEPSLAVEILNGLIYDNRWSGLPDKIKFRSIYQLFINDVFQKLDLDVNTDSCLILANLKKIEAAQDVSAPKYFQRMKLILSWQRALELGDDERARRLETETFEFHEFTLEEIEKIEKIRLEH